MAVAYMHRVTIEAIDTFKFYRNKSIIDISEVEVEVTLRPTVNRPVRLWRFAPFEAGDQMLHLFELQLLSLFFM
jgi:hypothetical protein